MARWDENCSSVNLSTLPWPIRVYRAWPWRPHCSASHHVWLCRVLGYEGNTRCPAKDA